MIFLQAPSTVLPWAPGAQPAPMDPAAAFAPPGPRFWTADPNAGEQTSIIIPLTENLNCKQKKKKIHSNSRNSKPHEHKFNP